MLVVIDTNILVSAFWSKNSNPAKIIGLVQNRVLTPCYDQRILSEYEDVLSRKAFMFNKWEVDDIISQIRHDGISVVAKTVNEIFIDVHDKKFYEVAKYCNATLITGNIKHFPIDMIVKSPASFIKHIGA